jgi:hypothetical protein
MPSTYTVNLGIEKPATGEQSGTWGDTVNDNSNILDEAINGVVSITLASAGSSGSPNSITITNGASSTGRNKWIEFADGGDLGAAAYVQLTPNDAEKICFIRNSLTASRSIFLFQGTYNASNDLEIAAGTDVVVKFNGGGTGATVVNVYANLKVDGIVATTADINGGTVDGTVIGGAAAAALTATTVVANTSLNIAGTTTISSVLDEDNMASDSATALATQQSIKAYVDSQVGTVDTLSEILANGNTTGATDIDVDGAQKVQFRDAAIYINSSVDGQLDIVADTEIQIAATTVDLNGNLDVSGTLGVTGVLTATSLDISGDIDVDGTTNLDVVDIDGAVDMASTLLVTGVLTTTAATVSNGGGQFNGAINVGVDDTGYDVKFFGATASAYMLWDESADDLILAGAAGLSVAGVATLASLVATTADINAGTIDGTVIGGTTAAAISGTTGQFGTSLNVDGTVTADGLTVEGTTATFGGASGEYKIIIEGSAAPRQNYIGMTGYDSLVIAADEDNLGVASDIQFRVDAKQVAAFSAGGDISFYEATGTTPKFFWDASDERLSLTGSDYQFGIQQGANQPWYHRATSNGKYSLHLNGTGDIMTLDTSGGLITNPAAGGHAVFNEGGVDADFRVESDSNANMLFVDGGRDKVFIGASGSDNDAVLLVQGDDVLHPVIKAAGANVNGFTMFSDNYTVDESISTFGIAYSSANLVLARGVKVSGSADNTYLSSQDTGAMQPAAIRLSNGTMKFLSAASSATVATDSAVTMVERLSVSPTEMVVNEAGVNMDFRVESDTNANMLWVDAALNSVQIGDGTADASTLLVSKAGDQDEDAPHIRIQGNGFSGFHWLDATAYYIGQNSTARAVRIYSGAETAGVALTNGSTSWATFSDERLKYDVENVENAVDTLSGLRCVKYRLKDVDEPTSQKKIGLVAQDLVGVLDEVLSPLKRTGDDTDYMTVRYTEVIPVLVKAIQELSARNDLLETRLAALEA